MSAKPQVSINGVVLTDYQTWILLQAAIDLRRNATRFSKDHNISSQQWGEIWGACSAIEQLLTMPPALSQDGIASPYGLTPAKTEG